MGAGPPGWTRVVPVVTWTAGVVSALAVVLAGWAAWHAVRDRPVLLRQLWLAAVVEAAVLVQLLLVSAVALGGRFAHDAATFWGYLVTTLIVLPLAALWAFAERTRWSSVVLLLASLTVVFLEWRLIQIWGDA